MTDASLSSALNACDLFGSLSQPELDAVAKQCEPLRYAKGEFLFLQAEPIAYVYFPLQGRIRLFSMSESGREQTFLVADNGDFFPHVDFARSGNYPYCAVAVQEAYCLALPVPAFAQLLADHPDMGCKMMQVLADKIIDLQQRLEAKAFYSTEGQLISLLLRLGETHGYAVDEERRQLTALFTNGELAGMLGTTSETVSRLFGKLKNLRAISVRKDGSLQIQVKQLGDMLPATSPPSRLST